MGSQEGVVTLEHSKVAVRRPGGLSFYLTPVAGALLLAASPHRDRTKF
jgi:hypothetical protein